MTDQRLAKLADEMEIRNLVARIAHLADIAGNLDEYFTLWTEDGVYDVREPVGWREGMPSKAKKVSGRAELMEDRAVLRSTGFQGPGSDVYHANATLEVRVGDGDTAEATSHWILIDGTDPASVRRVGIYEDTFRRTADGWKLAYRVVLPNGLG